MDLRLLVAAMLAMSTGCNYSEPTNPFVAGWPTSSALDTTRQPSRVFVANSYATYVTVYGKQRANLIFKLNRKLGRTYSLLMDSSGDLYVANSHGVTEYPPAAKSPSRVLRGTNYPAMALDSAGDLFAGSGHAIDVYTPGATSPSRQITYDVNGPTAMLFDSSGNLYVANQGADPDPAVEVYAPGQSIPTRSIVGFSGPVAMALDHEGNLYVADRDAKMISVFAAGTASLLRTLQVAVPSVPSSLAFDTSDHLYAADQDSVSGQIDVFKSQSSTILRTITSGVDGPEALTLDSQGRLYVANLGNNTVTAYAQNKNVVAQSYSQFINVPTAVVVGP
jgi:6-phosphogluconolactonase (cycloisomerase 2 family)